MTIRLANRVGAIDQPNERSPARRADAQARRSRRSSAGVFVAGLIWLPWDSESRAILIGAVVIALVGFVDDVFDLSPLPKLLGSDGRRDHSRLGRRHRRQLHLPLLRPPDAGDRRPADAARGGVVDLGEVAPCSAIVAVINVINLIDGVDGLAAGRLRDLRP